MSVRESGIGAGVIGVGNLGSNHARIYSASGEVGSLTLYDRDRRRAEETAGKYGAVVSSTIEELLDRCDLVSICTPATHHHEAAAMAFDRGVHVLVEKPIASSSIEGESMVKRGRDRGCILQVGHIERFNGAFNAVCPLLRKPLFIESHRLGIFTPRGIDVSVVVDLMIHDIDIVLTVLRGERLVDLRASGAGVLTGSPDIVNARMEFEGGCVANITASRISREPLRKIRFFQENLYVSADLKERRVEAFEKSEGVGIESLAADPTAFIRRLPVDVDRSEPLRKEIDSFIDAVQCRGEPVVTGEQALEALRVAEEVLDRIKENTGPK